MNRYKAWRMMRNNPILERYSHAYACLSSALTELPKQQNTQLQSLHQLLDTLQSKKYSRILAEDAFNYFTHYHNLIPDSKTLNYLIRQCSCDGKVTKAYYYYHLFSKLNIPPNMDTFDALIMTHASVNQITELEILLNKFQEQNWIISSTSLSKVYKMYCKTYKFNRLLSILSQFNSTLHQHYFDELIKYLYDNMEYDKLDTVYFKMKNLNLSFNQSQLAFFIQSFSRSSDHSEVLSIHQHVKLSFKLPSLEIMNLLLKYYCNLKSPDDVRNLILEFNLYYPNYFDVGQIIGRDSEQVSSLNSDTSTKNEHLGSLDTAANTHEFDHEYVWNYLNDDNSIASRNQTPNQSNPVKLYNESQDNFKQNQMKSYGTLIAYFCTLQKFDQVNYIYEKFFQLDWIKATQCLIKEYGKNQNHIKILFLLESIFSNISESTASNKSNSATSYPSSWHQPLSDLFTQILNHFRKHGKYMFMAYTYNLMKRMQLGNIRSYRVTILGYLKAKQYSEMEMVFGDMIKQGIPPTSYILELFINAFRRIKRPDRVKHYKKLLRDLTNTS
ncbi:hypothetical protein BC833DRAFT_608936 [Globomyces pollinis-pini]|nr:hypothetical protein BC833DRAFT_608936 [Globomyces pollinis-pini]